MKTIIFNIILFAAIGLLAFKPGQSETHEYYISYQTEQGASACTIVMSGLIANAQGIEAAEQIIKRKYGFETVVMISVIHLPID